MEYRPLTHFMPDVLGKLEHQVTLSKHLWDSFLMKARKFAVERSYITVRTQDNSFRVLQLVENLKNVSPPHSVESLCSFGDNYTWENPIAGNRKATFVKN